MIVVKNIEPVTGKALYKCYIYIHYYGYYYHVIVTVGLLFMLMIAELLFPHVEVEETDNPVSQIVFELYMKGFVAKRVIHHFWNFGDTAHGYIRWKDQSDSGIYKAKLSKYI